MRKSNVKLSDKEKLLDNFKMLEERRTKYIERQILNQVYKEINDPESRRNKKANSSKY